MKTLTQSLYMLGVHLIYYIHSSVMLWVILLAWFVSTCSLRGKSHCKSNNVLVSDQLYVMMKHFYPDGTGPG